MCIRDSSKAVREVFCTLFEKGLIYKGTRITNWCVNCNTALSDIEVEHKDDPGHLWYINYPVVEEEGDVYKRQIKVCKMLYFRTESGYS